MSPSMTASRKIPAVTPRRINEKQPGPLNRGTEADAHGYVTINDKSHLESPLAVRCENCSPAIFASPTHSAEPPLRGARPRHVVGGGLLLERGPVAGRSRVVQWVLIGGPYTVWSHRRQVRLPYVLAGLGLVTA